MYIKYYHIAWNRAKFHLPLDAFVLLWLLLLLAVALDSSLLCLFLRVFTSVGSGTTGNECMKC